MKTVHTINDDRAIREFRMVQACVNTKECLKHFRGVYFQFNTEGASITGTDGHRLVHVSNYPLESDFGHGGLVDMLVQLDAMIPKGTVALTLTVDHDAETAVLCAETTRSQKSIAGKVWKDVKYPKYQRILNGNRYARDREPTISSIVFNPMLIAELYAAFLPTGSAMAVGCEFRFGSVNNAFRVHLSGTDAEIVAMPMRV